MSWISDLIYVVTHKRSANSAELKQKVASAMEDHTIKIDNAELIEYIADIEDRIKDMVKSLKKIYKSYNITFTGFKSFTTACEYLKEVVKDKNEEAYNNLIKLESMITSEQQRHLALIRMAVTPDGKRVIEQITNNPAQKEVFDQVFGAKGATGKLVTDGSYQRIWSEIHKLSEYMLVQKNKIYH